MGGLQTFAELQNDGIMRLKRASAFTSFYFAELSAKSL